MPISMVRVRIVSTVALVFAGAWVPACSSSDSSPTDTTTQGPGAGGTTAGSGGSSAGSGGANAGNGGSKAGGGGSSAGTSGSGGSSAGTAGSGGSNAGAGGSNAGSGGSSAGTGGASAGGSNAGGAGGNPNPSCTDLGGTCVTSDAPPSVTCPNGNVMDNSSCPSNPEPGGGMTCCIPSGAGGSGGSAGSGGAAGNPNSPTCTDLGGTCVTTDVPPETACPGGTEVANSSCLSDPNPGGNETCCIPSGAGGSAGASGAAGAGGSNTQPTCTDLGGSCVTSDSPPSIACPNGNVMDNPSCPSNPEPGGGMTCCIPNGSGGAGGGG